MSPTPVHSPALAALPGIRHAFFTREGGVSAGIYASLNGGRGSKDDPAAVTENRRRMAAYLGVEEARFAAAHQVHSARAVITDAAWPLGQAPEADGVVTATPGLAVAVSIADCGPILFADPVARVVGAAHAGWKGALTGVLAATVEAMESLGASRGRITATLGPCIRQPSYEVGEEFLARFRAEDASFERFFAPAPRQGHALFDLGGFVMMRLQELGLAQASDLGLDTYPDEARFFSYRRTTHRGEPDYGRLMAAITLA